MYSLTNNPKFTNSNIGFFIVKRVLTDDDINYLNKFTDSFKLKKAGVVDKDDIYDGINYETRNTSICWIKPDMGDEQIKVIFRKIMSKILEVNNDVFQYDLTDLEPIQYTRYYMGDFYKSHIDMDSELMVGNTCRKLSFSIQLTDPSEYNGGDLLSYTGETPSVACKEKGSMTFFPSFLLHEVKPVSQGVRNALVGWCWGPKFK